MSRAITVSTELTDAVRKSLPASERPTAIIEIRPARFARLRRIPGGSVIAITARSPRIIQEIAAAARDGNYRRIDYLIGRVGLATFAWGLKRRKSRLSPDQIQAVTDFYYHDRKIAGGQFLAAGLPAMLSVLPFTGGKLEHDKFRARVYTQESARPPYTLVLISQPALSKLEQQILAQVPETESGLNLGGPSVEAAIVAATAAVLLGGAVFYGLYLVYQKMVADRQKQRQQERNQEVAVDATADDAAVEEDAAIEDANVDDANVDDVEVQIADDNAQEDNLIWVGGDDVTAEGDAYVLAADDQFAPAQQDDAFQMQAEDQAAQQDNVGAAEDVAAADNVGAAEDVAAADVGAGIGEAGAGGGFAVNAGELINQVAVTLREIEPTMAAEALLEMRTAMIEAGSLSV